MKSKAPKPQYKIGNIVMLNPKRFDERFIGIITLVEQGAQINFYTVKWDVDPSCELIHAEDSLVRIPTDNQIKFFRKMLK